MFSKRLLSWSCILSLTAWLCACSTTQPTAPEIPSGTVTSVREPVSFSDLPGWENDDFQDLWPAFVKSCQAIGRQPQWQGVCEKAMGIDTHDPLVLRSFFETHFVPYRVIAENGSDTGMATGYYEPMLKGSRVRTGKYQTALYRQPEDLLEVDMASVYPQLKGLRLRGKLIGNRVVPYDTRGELEKSGKLAGKEIVWVDDVIDAFFLEIQGSGRVYLPASGQTIRLAYANQNGRPYRSIGRYLIDRGELKPGQASAQQIRHWIKKNPKRMREVLDTNPSYVFFREEKITDPSVGPKGALGVPLTPERSIAVDRNHIPLGAPVFIDTTRPYSTVPLQKLVMAQDTGGAIRGAVRADYFWGWADHAAENAGKMKQKLKVWLLLPKQQDVEN